MPLYATTLALVDRVADGTNAGLRRDDALLRRPSATRAKRSA
jgi:hypothetical protein